MPIFSSVASGTTYGILYFLFMSAVILGAAYYVTRFLARKGLHPAKNKYLRIVETVPLGIDRSLLLVKVGEQYLLLGSTQKNISMLAQIEQDKLTGVNTGEMYGGSEDESFESYMSNIGNEHSKAGMNSVKHNLNKLKSIVRGNRTDD